MLAVTTPEPPLSSHAGLRHRGDSDPAAYIPPDVDMDAVSAASRRRRQRARRRRAGLLQVVADATHKGIDLKIVVLDHNPPIDTPLRDIATVVGDAYPGSTVLVLSPSFAGTYSPTFDRVTLEAGQDVAKTGNPVAVGAEFRQRVDHAPFSVDAIHDRAGSRGGGGRRRHPLAAGARPKRGRGVRNRLSRRRRLSAQSARPLANSKITIR